MQGEFLTIFYVNADKYFLAKIAKTEKEKSLIGIHFKDYESQLFELSIKLDCMVEGFV